MITKSSNSRVFISTLCVCGGGGVCVSCFICCVCVLHRFDFVKLQHWPGLSCERDLHLKGYIEVQYIQNQIWICINRKVIFDFKCPYISWFLICMSLLLFCSLLLQTATIHFKGYIRYAVTCCMVPEAKSCHFLEGTNSSCVLNTEGCVPRIFHEIYPGVYRAQKRHRSAL